MDELKYLLGYNESLSKRGRGPIWWMKHQNFPLGKRKSNLRYPRERIVYVRE